MKLYLGYGILKEKVSSSLCIGYLHINLDIQMAWVSLRFLCHRFSRHQSYSSYWHHRVDRHSDHWTPSHQSMSCESGGCMVESVMVSWRCGCLPDTQDSWIWRLSPHTCELPGDDWADTCHICHSESSCYGHQPGIKMIQNFSVPSI